MRFICSLFLLFFVACGDKVTISNIPPVVVPVLGEVVPLYTNYPKFLDFIRASDTTAVCNTGVDDSHDECLMAGLYRKVVVTGKASCSGLTLTEYLGVLSWSCSVIDGVATFTSNDFASGKGLKNLLDSTSFKQNRVDVYQNGIRILYTNLSTWWTDTVSELAGQTTLNTAGIYTIPSSATNDTITITASNIAIVTLGSSTLTYNTGTKNIPGLGVTATLVYSDQKFNYFELSMVPYNSGGTTRAVGIYASGHFCRFHNITSEEAYIGIASGGNANIFSGTNSITNSSYLSLGLATGDRNLIKGTLTLNNKVTSTNAAFTLVGGTTYNTLDANITISGAHLSIAGGSGNNTFNGSLSISNTQNGSALNISSGANNTFNGAITVDTVNGNYNNISLFTANNTFNGAITLRNNSLGYGIRVDATGNTFNGSVLIEDMSDGIWINGNVAGGNTTFTGAIEINNMDTEGISLINTTNNTFGAITIGGGASTPSIGILLQASSNNTFGNIVINDNDEGIILESDSNSNIFNGTISISNISLSAINVLSKSDNNSLTNITTSGIGNSDVALDSDGSNEPTGNTVTKVGHPGPQFSSCGGDAVVGFANTTSCP